MQACSLRGLFLRSVRRISLKSTCGWQQHMPVRSFASQRRATTRRRGGVVKNSSSSSFPSSTAVNNNADSRVPLLSAVLKKLYLKVHPDLLHAFPIASSTNEESLKRVMDFLQDIKSTDPDTPFPAAANHRLAFYVRKEGSQGNSASDYRKVTLHLYTTGGNCKSIVEKSLSEFFRKLELPTTFRWDKAYWVLRPPRLREKEEEGDMDMSGFAP